MRRLSILLLNVLVILSPSWAIAESLYPVEPTVRVRVIHTLDSIQVNYHGSWKLVDDQAREFARENGTHDLMIVKDNHLFLDGSVDGISKFTLEGIEDSCYLEVADVPYGVGWWWEGRENRFYDGSVTVFPNMDGHMSMVIALPLEDYLKGVVPYEIGPDAPLEALKAQAVAARSEAITALNSTLYSGPGYDMTSDVECQVYSGNERRNANTDRAIEETASLILSAEGKPIHAYFASNCGGHSELIENVWPNRDRPLPYLEAGADSPERQDLVLTGNLRARWRIRRRPDVYCNPARHAAVPGWSARNFRWERGFDREDLTTMLSPGNDIGKFKRLKVMERGHSGRAIRVKVIFEKDSYEVAGELAIRQLFDPPLRSSNFIVRNRIGHIQIKGAGWGHGVGMCQTGAIVQAAEGADFKHILNHYYPGAEILSVYHSRKRDAGWFILESGVLPDTAQHTEHAARLGSQAPVINRKVLEAIDIVQATAMDGGGYFVGITADPPESPIGYNLALFGKPLLKAPRTTSYCSGSTYTAFIEALNLLYPDGAEKVTAERYESLRMQEKDGGRREDGVQFWGKWNDDGYGNHFALLQYSRMGSRIMPAEARPGDFLNISWKSGLGHSVVFLGWTYNEDGEKCVAFWSSQRGTNGLGDAVVPISRIREVMFVRMDHPERVFSFDPKTSVERKVQGDIIDW